MNYIFAGDDYSPNLEIMSIILFTFLNYVISVS